jgi:hypothetical protein
MVAGGEVTRVAEFGRTESLDFSERYLENRETP